MNPRLPQTSRANPVECYSTHQEKLRLLSCWWVYSILHHSVSILHKICHPVISILYHIISVSIIFYHLGESAPEASWRRVLYPCAPLLLDLYHYLEQNGYFWLVSEHAPSPSSQVLPGYRVRHPCYSKKLFVWSILYHIISVGFVCEYDIILVSIPYITSFLWVFSIKSVIRECSLYAIISMRNIYIISYHLGEFCLRLLCHLGEYTLYYIISVSILYKICHPWVFSVLYSIISVSNTYMISFRLGEFCLSLLCHLGGFTLYHIISVSVPARKAS